ncbi:SET domain-containing protein [Pseudoscourfieldia marina]
MAHADALDVGARVTKLIEDGNNESEGTGTATDEQGTGRYTHVVTFDNGDVENFTLKQLREQCTLVVPAPVVNNNLEAATTRQRDDDTTGKEEVPSLGKRKVASLFSEPEEVPDVLLPMLDAARLTQPPPQVQKRGPGTPRKAPPPPPSPPPPMPSPIPPQPPEPSGKNLLQAAAQLTPQPSPAVAQAAAELTPLGMGMMGIGSNHIDDVIVIDLEVEDSEDVRARPSRACARPSRRTIVDDMVDLDDDHRLAFYQNDDETVAKGKEAAMRSEDAAPTPNAGTSDAAKYRGVRPHRCSGTFLAALKVNNVSVHLCNSKDATKLALIRDYVIRECNLTNARNFDDTTTLPREYLEEATAAVVKTKGYQKAGNVPPPPPYQNDDETVAKGKAAMRSEDAAPTPNAGTSGAAKYRGVYPSQRYVGEFYAQLCRNNKNCHIGNSKDATKLALIRDYVIRVCNLTNARNFDDATTLPREYLEEALAAVVKTKRYLDSGNVPPYQNDDETVAKGKAAMRSGEDAAPTPNAGTSDAANYRGVYPSRCSSGTFLAALKVNNVSVHLCKSDDATKLALIRDYVIRECNLTNARNFDDTTTLPREYLEEATAAVVKTKGYQKAGNVPPPPPYQNDDETVAKGKAAMRSGDAAPTSNAGSSDAAKYRGVYKYPNRQELFYYAQVSRNHKGCHIGNSKDATKLALIRDFVIRVCKLTNARNFDDTTTLPREYLEEALAAVVKTKRYLDSGNVPPPPSYQEAEKHGKKKTLSKGVPFSCKGVGTLSSMIGRRVTKKFSDRFYNGVVDGCEGTMRWYHITYDDGDAEDIAFTEFLELTHGPADINNAFFTAKGAEQVSRVLGCTFATETARSVWDACWSRAKKQRQDPKMLPGIGGFEVKSCYDADHPSCLSSTNLFESISKYLTDLGFDVGASVYHGATPMLPLNAPHHLNLEEYVVAADDPREELRGQKGCRVKPDSQPIAAGTTLGVYGGELLMSGEVHELKSVKDSVQGGILCFLRAELQAECFTEEFNHFNYEQGEEIPLDGEKLAVCAVDVNDNLMHRINDVRISPLSKKSEMLPGGANVEYVETCVCGFPFVFLVARQDLAPSQDLRGNYGDAYWHMVREYVSRIKVCKEAATFNP